MVTFIKILGPELMLTTSSISFCLYFDRSSADLLETFQTPFCAYEKSVTEI